MSDDRSLEDQVRAHGGPLLSRLAIARRRANELARKERAPVISLPPKWSDDNIFIDVRSKTCCFCNEAFTSLALLKDHSTACAQHPANQRNQKEVIP